MMMGGWFVATAIGNYMVSIIGYLWGGIELWMVWSVLIVLCLLSALFHFLHHEELEKVALRNIFGETFSCKVPGNLKKLKTP